MLFESFSIVLDFLQNEGISIDINNSTYTFTFWQIAISLMVINLAIYIVERILNG